MSGQPEVVVADEHGIVVLDLEGVVVQVCERAELRSTGVLSEDASLTIEIAYDASLRRIVAERVSVERAGVGNEVTARLIREVRVQESIVSVAMRDMISVYRRDERGEPLEQTLQSGEEALAAIQPLQGRERASATQDAAIVYVLATLASWPPLKTVADQLGVSQSTATRLVSESRVRERLG